MPHPISNYISYEYREKFIPAKFIPARYWHWAIDVDGDDLEPIAKEAETKGFVVAMHYDAMDDLTYLRIDTTDDHHILFRAQGCISRKR